MELNFSLLFIFFLSLKLEQREEIHNGGEGRVLEILNSVTSETS
jgi:hypothetical protein